MSWWQSGHGSSTLRLSFDIYTLSMCYLWTGAWKNERYQSSTYKTILCILHCQWNEYLLSKSSTLIRKSTFMSSKKARTFRVKTSCPPTPLQRPIRVPTPLVNLLSTAQRLIKTMLKWSNSSDHCNPPCSKWNNLIVFGDCRQLIWTLSFFRSKRVILNICAFLSLFTVVIRAAPTPSVLADSLSKRNAIPGPSPVCFRRTCTWSDIYYWFELEAWRSSMYK